MTRSNPLGTRHRDSATWMAAASLALISCSSSPERPPSGSPLAEAAALNPMSPGRELRGFGFPSTIEASFNAGEFILSLSIRRQGTEYELRGYEVDPEVEAESPCATAEGLEWSMIEAHSGPPIERAVMRHANEWFLALRHPSGLVDIECWTLDRTAGAYYSAHPTSAFGIGSALTTPATEVGIEQEVFVIPSRRPRPRLTKSKVIRGLTLPVIERMAVDPDGRYLLMIVDSTQRPHVVQVALIDSPMIAVGATIPLWDYTSADETDRWSHELTLLEHATRGGRTVLLGGGWTDVYLWDADNDGVFERHELQQIGAGGAFTWENWSRSW